MKEFNVEEMEQGNGKEGRPVYVAHEGKVYDVTGSKMWKGGLHMNRHHAGKDLTTDILAAPHDPSVLERYPQVGTLREGRPPQRELPEFLSRLLKRAPFLRRHPHPMTIHFPIVFTFATLTFNVLYLIFGIDAFEITALNCLGAAVFFTPVAISTGFYTWWLNYQSKPIRPVKIKQRLSFLLFAVEIVALVWRLKDPHVFDSFGWRGILFFLLILFMFIVVFVIGWFGATLTFPIEKPGNK